MWFGNFLVYLSIQRAVQSSRLSNSEHFNHPEIDTSFLSAVIHHHSFLYESLVTSNLSLEFACSGCFIYIDSNSLWSFVTCFFRLVSCFQGPSVLQHVTVLLYLLRSNHIPLYGCTTGFTCIHSLIDIVSTFGQYE